MTERELSKTDEYYEKYTKPMELPKGKTCSDCIHFERTCKWLISCKPDRITCDWNPSRFKENEV
ncbi:hypothetical protein [Nitrososphaeria virus YSH_462411]|uniref:Uncharacterized protein n=1 Tax=Nitrososphaeria virus YSH_462411 TaxID=3071321 RepID=A0A976UAI0_9CAUD|nr:hypothetical protein QKV92_gp52 [Yangshan Harbor Nitrososphaeria virus]UVF62324.1 hypothetical protein [Nitrososphaeria virus YSH_462411]